MCIRDRVIVVCVLYACFCVNDYVKYMFTVVVVGFIVFEYLFNKFISSSLNLMSVVLNRACVEFVCWRGDCFYFACYNVC